MVLHTTTATNDMSTPPCNHVCCPSLNTGSHSSPSPDLSPSSSPSLSPSSTCSPIPTYSALSAAPEQATAPANHGSFYGTPWDFLAGHDSATHPMALPWDCHDTFMGFRRILMKAPLHLHGPSCAVMSFHDTLMDFFLSIYVLCHKAFMNRAPCRFHLSFHGSFRGESFHADMGASRVLWGLPRQSHPSP